MIQQFLKVMSLSQPKWRSILKTHFVELKALKKSPNHPHINENRNVIDTAKKIIRLSKVQDVKSIVAQWCSNAKMRLDRTIYQKRKILSS